MRQFSDHSASFYDMFNMEKNYKREAQIVESYFYKKNDSLILDLGCGTGNHFGYFLEAGYAIDGHDLSLEMVELARVKHLSYKKLNLYVTDLSRLEINRNDYSNVISLYSVLGYLQNFDALIELFKKVSNCLLINGRFIFDVWNADAVEKIGPSSRSKTVFHENVKYKRTSTSTINKSDKCVEVKFEYFKESELFATEQIHKVRYFRKSEITRAAHLANLKVSAVVIHPNVNAFDVDGWNALYVLEK